MILYDIYNNGNHLINLAEINSIFRTNFNYCIQMKNDDRYYIGTGAIYDRLIAALKQYQEGNNNE